MVLAANETVGKYRHLLKLGEGGTANVYLAVVHGPSGFNKLVVMKTLKQSLASDSENVAMFLSEARIAARLSHPNIVQTNEITDDGATPSIVMEYLEGQPLSAIFARARGNIPLGIHIRILLEVLSGLHYTHELTDYDGTPLSLVHRDVTPQNVFVTFDGEIKVLDFGIAKVTSGDPHTGVGVVKGKVRYMPPEQIHGITIDRRADLFAVGVMLWEALVGARMWSGQSDVTVMNKVSTGQFPTPKSVRPNINQHLEQICCKALAIAPDQRYETAAEFEAELETAAVASCDMGLPGNREIGRFVTELFTEERTGVRRVIDKQLKEISSLSWEEYLAKAAQVPLVTLPAPSSITTTPAPLTASVSGPSPETSWSSRLRRNGWVFYATGVPLVLLLLLLYWVTGARGTSSSGVMSNAQAPLPLSPPAATPAPTAVLSFTVWLRAQPAHATLFIDETALPTNPYTGSLPKGQYLLRAETEGYLPKRVAVIIDKDLDYTFALEPIKVRATDKPLANGRRRAPAPASKVKEERATPATPAASCGMPYFVDEKGIKRIKPECM